MLHYSCIKYRIILFVVFVIAGINQANAQKDSLNSYQDYLEAGREELLALNYPVALEYFQKVYDATKSGESALGIGICKYNLPSQRSNSEKYFLDALEKRQHEANYYLAQLNHLNKNFDEAIRYYVNYLSNGEYSVNWNHVNFLLNKSLAAKEFINKPVGVVIENPGAPMNTSYAEYLPLPGYDDSSIVFTSRRPVSSVTNRDPYGEPFEDVYSITFSEYKNSWKEPVRLNETINSVLHDAAVSLIPYGNEMIIYRTNPDFKSGSLWFTTRKKNEWTPLISFGENINVKGSWVSSACFGPGMQMVIFSSNMPGGFGGKDLYRSIRLPGGKWSLPVNLGPTVNTEHDETSPNLSPDAKYLYFSSKGHHNMGGYDIFRSKREADGNYSVPENLGYPINSVDDDLHFIIDPITGDAWFSSIRPEGFGSFDIYKIRAFQYLNQEWVVIRGTVTMINSDQFVKATLTVIDEDAHIVQGIYRPAANTGKYILTLLPYRKYRIIIEAEGASPEIMDFIPEKETNMDFKLRRKE